MATPGIGVGDIVLLCQTIAKYAKRYKDAPEEFGEIAVKASSTAVLLTRIDREVAREGNIVKRDGPHALRELHDNLTSLRADCKKLENLVKRYDKIRDEGPGRRMLWAFKESGNIDDMRRQIGLHEQSLQLWYMTLMTGSLRRIEGGQKNILIDQAKMREMLRGIQLAKTLDPNTSAKIRQSALKGDLAPLARAMRQSQIGVSPPPRPSRYSTHSQPEFCAPPVPEQRHARMHASSVRPSASTNYVGNNYADADALYEQLKVNKEAQLAMFNETLQAVSEYITADPVDKMELERKLQAASTVSPPEVMPYDDEEYITRQHSASQSKHDPSSLHPELYRSKSTGHERKRPSQERRGYDESSQNFPSKGTFGNLLHVPGESFRPRRLSDDSIMISRPQRGHRRKSSESATYEPRGESRSSERKDRQEMSPSRRTPPSVSDARHASGPRYPPSELYGDDFEFVQEIHVSGPPPPPPPAPTRHRSTSRHSVHREEGQRDSSRHSYVRERSSSRDRNRIEKVYVIRRKERSDSTDV